MAREDSAGSLKVAVAASMTETTVATNAHDGGAHLPADAAALSRLLEPGPGADRFEDGEVPGPKVLDAEEFTVLPNAQQERP